MSASEGDDGTKVHGPGVRGAHIPCSRARPNRSTPVDRMHHCWGKQGLDWIGKGRVFLSVSAGPQCSFMHGSRCPKSPLSTVGGWIESLSRARDRVHRRRRLSRPPSSCRVVVTVVAVSFAFRVLIRERFSSSLSLLLCIPPPPPLDHLEGRAFWIWLFNFSRSRELQRLAHQVQTRPSPSSCARLSLLGCCWGRQQSPHTYVVAPGSSRGTRPGAWLRHCRQICSCGWGQVGSIETRSTDFLRCCCAAAALAWAAGAARAAGGCCGAQGGGACGGLVAGAADD